MAQLAPLGVPVSDIRELPDVVEDPQLESRNTFVTLPSPLNPKESITVVKAGYVTDTDGPEVRSGPPTLGFHTDEILSSIGYDNAMIAALREKGAI